MNSETHIGHYKIVEELGRGGMGVVYKAFEDSLSRHVAIKMLSQQLADRADVVERFKREAKSMGALNDPHIIQVYFIGEQDGQPYFVMEFVEGESLSQRMRREGKLPVKEAMRILKETASGLATAHDRGVIHRDIKPGNLMLDTRGRVKIADFGIAMTHDFGDRLTRTGEFVGTPGYLSPEVCTGKQVDQRSDIFALGIVFYEMLTGDLPFTESSPLGMMLEVVQAEIPDVRELNSEVDDRTHRILTRMIAKDPDDRYQDCQKLLDDLEHVTQLSMFPAEEPSTMVSSPGATVAMATPPPSAQEPAASDASQQAIAQRTGQELAVRDEPRRTVWPAFAIIAILAVGAGTTYAFRDRLFGDQEAATDKSPETAMASRAVQATASEASPAAEATPSAETEAQPEQVTSAARAEPADAPPETTPPPEEDASGADPVKQSSETTVALNSQATVDTQSPSEDPGAALRTSITRSVDQAFKQPVEQPPPPPPEPRVVVLSVGDPAITGPVSRMLENKLMGAELDVLDSSFISGLDRAMGPNGVDLGAASSIITDAGGTLLVLAEVEYVGETELQYYGQYSTLYTVNLNVRTYDLQQRRALGPGISEKIDFTSLNAEQKAKEALSPHLARIADSVRARAEKS
ncbi:MAG: serine/threonine-protein kinase [Xanthomonadales bacterium]|nr:serine/threonine-protein kinase [Xanthomonadales bacterium]